MDAQFYVSVKVTVRRDKIGSGFNGDFITSLTYLSGET